MAPIKHGHRRTKASPEYVAWRSMIDRCKNQNLKSYGGKGISVCRRWMKFENFLADMGTRPAGFRISIERKKNSVGYTPKNCIWATPLDQTRNRTNTRKVTIAGKKMTLSEAMEIRSTKACYQTVIWRLNNGWNHERALQ